ncbi:sensory box histidine kinase/response regulator [Enhygromyxa salina]|uniref:histidine kinase n=1 Tax=Enhygromyxa salina TaxID=215803 RepID=A0A0C2CRA1_9BACT|nr:PAS domain S-box protein [Enhygromyxa salina]KIG12195.1 sensory box histidine kinase/response regulator [Enhygromyxa salina]
MSADSPEPEIDGSSHDPKLAFETWRGLFDALSEPIYVQDRDGSFLEVNRAAVEIHGYTREELIGASPALLGAPGRVDIESTLDAVRLALDGQPQVFSWWSRHKDGSEFPKEISLTKASFFGKDVVIAVVRDVREQIDREAALMSTEARYRAVFELANDGMLIADCDTGEVRSVNRCAEELFGLARDQLRGRKLVELLNPAGDDAYGTRAERLERLTAALAKRDGTSSIIKWSLHGAGVELRWVDLGFSPLPAAEGEGGAHLVVSIHDYTEKKRASEALRTVEQRERVAERLRALGELAAGVAHNFNNALTSILAHTQVLARSDDLPQWAREDLLVIERVSRGAAVTIRRIQSFARTRDPDALEAADLADVVANAVALTRPRWHPPGGDGKWDLDWTPSEVRLPIIGNGAELCEVIVNLILNGLDAMPEGGRLTVSTGLDGDRVWVEVGDTGVGIDAGSQRRLFDPFFSTKGRQGLGLGLSVSHGIVGRHHGEISVLSEPGHGSKFTVWLPLGEHVGETEGGTMGGARPSIILLVDDDPVVRRSLGQMLEQLGHEVVMAEHGKEALIRLDERPDIDLVLTDLAMPVLDGAGLVRECARRWPKLPRILMTGLVADAEPGLVELTDLILSKPIDLAVLDRVLARLLPSMPLA